VIQEYEKEPLEILCKDFKEVDDDDDAATTVPDDEDPSIDDDTLEENWANVEESTSASASASSFLAL